QLLAAQTVSVDAFGSGGQSVAFPLAMTQSGMDKARTAIKAYLTTCANLTNANPEPTTCPQTISNLPPYQGQWQIIGDPTQDLAISSDQSLNLVASGHFQMVFGYREDGF